MVPRPTSPAMEPSCGRQSPASPPQSPPVVLAPVAVKPQLSEVHAAAAAAAAAITAGPTDQQRLLYQLALAERLRLASAGLAWARPPLPQLAHHPHLQDNGAGGLVGGLMGGLAPGLLGATHPLGAHLGGHFMGPTHPLATYRLFDPRTLMLPRGPEEPKPQHSYIGLIAMAILSVPDNKLVLSDIYQHILDHYAYFRARGPGWRNSIRHNLSLNDCFVKSGRAANGKGHYWAIHPANVDDFRRGDFRRRRAQRRVRKHLGLAVDDDSEPETTSSPPPAPSQVLESIHPTRDTDLTRPRRQFDVLSLLAPDIRPTPPLLLPLNAPPRPLQEEQHATTPPPPEQESQHFEEDRKEQPWSPVPWPIHLAYQNQPSHTHPTIPTHSSNPSHSIPIHSTQSSNPSHSTIPIHSSNSTHSSNPTHATQTTNSTPLKPSANLQATSIIYNTSIIHNTFINNNNRSPPSPSHPQLSPKPTHSPQSVTVTHSPPTAPKSSPTGSHISSTQLTLSSPLPDTLLAAL